jgi:peptide-methionine (S)-S-oxide reductase
MNFPKQKTLGALRSRGTGLLSAFSLGATVLFLSMHVAHSSEAAVVIAPPAVDEPVGATHQETAVLAGGCFWGVQGVFQHVNGVTKVVSGYAGGQANTAQYETVSGGQTGHAESVQITYDPTKVTYGQLLQIYFSVAHDPTELNRQGPDSGTQYRSAIFPANDMQEHVAQSYIAQLNEAHAFSAPIVTKVTKTDALKGFYPAESYHQNYLTLHPDAPYIAVNDLPKVENLKRLYPAFYRDQPVLLKVASE